jgi:hypothetical protein
MEFIMEREEDLNYMENSQNSKERRRRRFYVKQPLKVQICKDRK